MSTSVVRRISPVLLTCVVLLGAAACGDDDDTASTSGTEVTSDTLDGRTFVSTEVTGETLVDGSEVTVSFEGEGLSANAGCNTMNSNYTLENDILTAGPFAQTQMACADDLQQQDVWVSELLGGGPSVTLDGNTLTIASPDTTVTFEES
jgi:heat shock protein HslJ